MLLRRRNAKAATPAAVQLRVPAAGTIVSVELEDVSRVWRSRIEVQEGRELVLVAPTRPMGPPILPDPGVAVRIGWPSDVGYLEATATLTATQPDEIALWDVTVESSEISQRRAAFRLDLRVPVTLAVDGEAEREGTTKNLSETGLACEFDGRHELEAGQPVQVGIQLPIGVILREGRIIRTIDRVPLGLEVGVAFGPAPEPETTRLRQFIFEEQLARRAFERG